MKCSAIRVNGEWRDVYKDPISDSGKKSKRGVQTTDDMGLRFVSGQILNQTNLEEIRARVAKFLT
jgi:nicotinamide phosphoribosyltransferase